MGDFWEKITKIIFKTRTENLEKLAEKGGGASDLAERIESLNEERGAFEEQSQKYKIAIGAQKRYIGKWIQKSIAP